ncbi:MAG: hypothetical protein PHN72_06365 [Bacilli bacterium]|nr:hypothetical protein [Bacilli bacterium]
MIAENLDIYERMLDDEESIKEYKEIENFENKQQFDGKIEKIIDSYIIHFQSSVKDVKKEQIEILKNTPKYLWNSYCSKYELIDLTSASVDQLISSFIHKIYLKKCLKVLSTYYKEQKATLAVQSKYSKSCLYATVLSDLLLRSQIVYQNKVMKEEAVQKGLSVTCTDDYLNEETEKVLEIVKQDIRNLK